MPWSVKKNDGKFCVVKEGETSPISGGCHDAKSEAAAHVRALYASEAEHAVSAIYTEEDSMETETTEDFEEFSEGVSYEFSDTMKEYAWEGPIVFENITTGDNRVFKADSINWQEDTLPWAFRWQKASGQGHVGSVPIGRVDRIERKEDGSIHGFGVIIPELSAEATEYYKILKAGVGGGVSVDGDSAQFEIQEQEGSQPKVEFSSMRLRALSAVDIPAFNGARIHLIEDEPAVEVRTDLGEPEVLESESPEALEITDLQEELAKKPFPFEKKDDEDSEDEDSEDEDSEDEDKDPKQEAQDNFKAMIAAKKAKGKKNIEAQVETDFATKTEDGEAFPASDYAYVPDPDMPSTWKLRLTSTPGGDPDPGIVGAAIAALGKGFRGNKVEIPSSDLSKVKAKVRAAWKKANSDKSDDEMPEVIQMSYGWNVADSLVAAAIPALPSTEAFVDPVFDGPTPLTVTPDGKVFGHLALFNTCHIGFPGTCVKPPKGSKYQYFHTGQIETIEGDLVEVGRLTFKTGHAAMADSPRIAAEHYDNTGAVAADVRAGEDKFGIWVAGALRSHLTDEDIREFRAAPLSGDWRRIAGKLELVGALSVNIPGFPVPRVRALVASGETETLITFIEDDDEQFNISDEELDMRLDKKIELASKMAGFFGEIPSEKIPEGAIKEDVPNAPTKKEILARAENYTKNEFFADLKALRELLDDTDEKMTAKVRNGLEELYSLAVQTDSEGKRTTYSGYDLDIIENSGLEIEEWEAQLELSGLDVQEFYNQCHGEGGRFCEGTDGPGRVRDNVQGKHFIPGEPHGKDHPAHKSGGSSGGGTSSSSSSGSSSGSSGGSSSSGGGGSPGGGGGNPFSGGGGGVNNRLYENHLITRKRARGWAAAATIAALALHSPASPLLAGLAKAGGLAIIANPAVLSLLLVTGVAYAGKNIVTSRKHRAEYNRQVTKKLAKDRLNQRQQRERDRLDVSS